MSKEVADLPNPVDAYNQLFDGVHAQVFFGKLANYGVQPTTEKEAMDLLTLAGQLRHVDSAEKRAADQSRFQGAVASLQSVYGQSDAGKQNQAYLADQAIKQAAEDLMNDPSIYNSVLSLKAAEAAALAGQE